MTTEYLHKAYGREAHNRLMADQRKANLQASDVVLSKISGLTTRDAPILLGRTPPKGGG
jgi:hypothetical protein